MVKKAEEVDGKISEITLKIQLIKHRDVFNDMMQMPLHIAYVVPNPLMRLRVLFASRLNIQNISVRP